MGLAQNVWSLTPISSLRPCLDAHVFIPIHIC
jgi:hypothetical protein